MHSAHGHLALRPQAALETHQLLQRYHSRFAPCRDANKTLFQSLCAMACGRRRSEAFEIHCNMLGMAERPPVAISGAFVLSYTGGVGVNLHIR